MQKGSLHCALQKIPHFFVSVLNTWISKWKEENPHPHKWFRLHSIQSRLPFSFFFWINDLTDISNPFSLAPALLPERLPNAFSPWCGLNNNEVRYLKKKQMCYRWTTSHPSFVVCTQSGVWIPPSFPTSSNSLAARGVATMFNAACGVRSSASGRKRSLCSGLTYVRNIPSNGCVCAFKLLFWQLRRDLQQNAALSLTTSSAAVWTFDGGRRARTLTTTGRSHSARGRTRTDQLLLFFLFFFKHPLWIYLAYTPVYSLSP